MLKQGTDFLFEIIEVEITRVDCTFVSPSADSRKAVVSYWQKYVHKVLVNHLGDLSVPRYSVVKSTDCPDMTAIYHGRKTTTATNQNYQVLGFMMPLTS